VQPHTADKRAKDSAFGNKPDRPLNFWMQYSVIWKGILDAYCYALSNE